MDAAGNERWERVEDAFVRALDLDPGRRAALLTRTFPTEPDLRAEVERLLAAHDAAGDFLATLDRERSAKLLEAAGDPDRLPEVVGRFRVIRRLGSGAMGVVYLAHDPQLERPVALKLLHGTERIPLLAQRRLLEEARAASALDHPGVAAIHEVGQTDDGQPYIAMAYCEGESLAARIARGALSPQEAARIGRQLAEALRAAHVLGIVHRDVKPANVVVAPDGRTRLMDFGIASLGGAAEAAAGTPAYMSPEQRRGDPPQPASDIWALGIVLHEMLTGGRPRTAGQGGTGRPAVPGAPATPQVRPPRRLGRLVTSCLARDPAARPAAGQVAAELRRFLDKPAIPLRRRLSLVAVTGVVVATLVLAWRTRSAGDGAEPGALLVLPFLPAAPDTALERIGRELVVTLGASLDGIAGMRVVDPLAVLGQPALHQASLGEALPAALAAASGPVLRGRISRDGTAIRVVATVHDDANASVLAQATATASAGDIGALTDSLTLALVRTRWAERGLSAPSAAAITTRSVAAMRAYLEGELAVAGARFHLAPEAFARAIAADSTFWFAYWRYWFARSYHGAPIDSSIIATAIAHRTSFPEPDRLLVEARMTTSSRTRLERLRQLTARHPTYWPAWFELGDHLTHQGAFLGVPIEEASVALRRTAELNPRFVPAWEHLFWTSLLRRDTIETDRVLRSLQRLRVDTLAPQEWDLQPLDYYGYLDHLVRSGGEPREADAAVGVDVLTGTVGAVEPERRVSTLLLYGFARAQLDLSRRIVERTPGTRVASAHEWGSALAWAGRGAWDSAFVAARAYARSSAHPRGAVWAYGLAVVGAWLGAVDPDSAVQLRPAALRSPDGRAADGSAEIAWLDGIIACTRGDAYALARQRIQLAQAMGTGEVALARSLAAFEVAAAGDRSGAGRMLAALERENADRGWAFRHGARHPFATGVNRLAAAHWLLEAGDTADATAFLLLHETDVPNTLQPLAAAQQIIGNAAIALLARVEDGRGRTASAERLRRMLVERADLDAGPAAAVPTCASR